ncbi:MAG: restriction endonuclease subunit S [Novosphingobium sp.]|nr:restriction endonuclease subunit S [Novosphingobium sp.]
MSEWRQAILGELVRLQRGHDLTETQRTPGTVPVIGSAGPNGWHNVARAKGPGVTVGRSGASAGVVTFVNENYWPHNTVLYVTDFLGNDPLFAAYMLRTLPLAELNSGSAQASLNRNCLYGVPIAIPPLETQRRIAAVLGAYDDLIEVNRRRVAVLEEMARGLFEEWFVRFRFPGHEAATIVDTPDGQLPWGWSVGELGGLLHLQYGKALKADTRVPGDVSVIGSSGVVGTHTARLVRGPGIVVGRKGNVGSVIWSTKDFWPIDTSYFVETALPLMFVYELLRRVPFQNTDAAVPGLNRDYALSRRVTVPTGDLIERYGRFAQPIRDQLDALETSNEKLAASRDLLLPRLISGQLSVETAQRELEDAT